MYKPFPSSGHLPRCRRRRPDGTHKGAHRWRPETEGRHLSNNIRAVGSGGGGILGFAVCFFLPCFLPQAVRCLLITSTRPMSPRASYKRRSAGPSPSPPQLVALAHTYIHTWPNFFRECMSRLARPSRHCGGGTTLTSGIS